MRPVCQAVRAAAHYEPPEQRTVDAPGADASGGGLTNQAMHRNKTETCLHNAPITNIHILVFLSARVD